jgi:hypothetical protein
LFCAVFFQNNSEDEIQHLDTMVKVIEKRLHEQWSRNVAKAQQSSMISSTTSSGNSSSAAAVADSSGSASTDTDTTAVATATHGNSSTSNSLKPCSSTDNILAPTDNSSSNHHADSYGAV